MKPIEFFNDKNYVGGTAGVPVNFVNDVGYADGTAGMPAIYANGVGYADGTAGVPAIYVNGVGYADSSVVTANVASGANCVSADAVVAVPMINKYLSAKRYRAILAAEGGGVFVNDVQEMTARRNVLLNVIQMHVFLSEFYAVMWLMEATVAYANLMLGDQVSKYMKLPRVLTVDRYFEFEPEMIKAISNRNIDFLDQASVPIANRALL